MFKRDQSYSIKINHIHNESANLIDSYDVFDTNDWSNLTKATTVIGIWIMAVRARLLNKGDYLTPGICSLLKPATMGHSRHIPPNPTQSCYNFEPFCQPRYFKVVIYLVEPLAITLSQNYNILSFKFGYSPGYLCNPTEMPLTTQK